LFTAFRDSDEVCQIIVKAEALKDAVQELNDVSGAVSVCVDLKTVQGMKLSTSGNMGICEIDFPVASDAFVSFRSQVWVYIYTYMYV
jgi:adenine deaminase